MSSVSFFFAGGGTGGHIYPLLSIAEQILARQPDAGIHFFHSTRSVDQRVFEKIPFQRTALPATGLSFHPMKFLHFVSTFRQSYQQAKQLMAASGHPVVIGAGGFVAAPVCRAGRKLGVPVALVNVDLLPGRANKLSARWADEIFVQFEESKDCFKHSRAIVSTVGCPLRSSFDHPDPDKALAELGLDRSKNVLLITGASSGSTRINEAVSHLLPQLEQFADRWQIVHLTGLDNYPMVLNRYNGAKIAHKVLDYYDNMADLFAATDLVIGRSGAVSVAEYAVAGVPSICMPYPHHKDRHQYLNAGKLVEVGAAVIVDDVPDLDDRTGWLWEELEDLMTHDEKREEMSQACKEVARPGAASAIAERLLQMAR
ncbi:MAG: UDP-N-acetylglucosamine--N-acetylmuramyl-(pentapeptide) pyrophosphoryl-undecaprenol N-acetylglucosamine transferase [Phycisphaerae bacterium]|nr:UDP-N-acetylglucosamine--N-acetylmuramyl-(pentapeptide) pyrophosphoryl-undecaprenol N-acetylglucosamine transferase [Phycisphaerae bacterium]